MMDVFSGALTKHRMATKLIRLTSDGKKEARRDGQPLAGLYEGRRSKLYYDVNTNFLYVAIHLRQHDLETEDMIADLQSKIREVEKENTSLKGKVSEEF